MIVKGGGSVVPNIGSVGGLIVGTRGRGMYNKGGGEFLLAGSS